MHYHNSKKSLIIFWSVMASVSLMGFSIGLYLRSRGYDSSITTNNIAAAVIFCAIMSAVSYHETFPYVLSMGCTRKGFAIGFATYNILFSLFIATVFNILVIIEFFVFRAMGFSPNIYGYMDNTINLQQFMFNILFHTVLLMGISALTALLLSIYNLKGMLYLYELGGLIIVAMFIPKVRESTFEALRYMGLALLRMVSPTKFIIYFLLFFAACYLMILPIAKATQVKR